MNGGESGPALLKDRGGQVYEPQISCHGLGSFGKGVSEHLVKSVAFSGVATLVKEDPAECDDWVSLLRIGIAACEIGAEINGGQRLLLTFGGGLYSLA